MYFLCLVFWSQKKEDPKSARFSRVNIFHANTMTLTVSEFLYLFVKDVQGFLQSVTSPKSLPFTNQVLQFDLV